MRDWWAGMAAALRRHPRAAAAGGSGLLAAVGGAIAAVLLLTAPGVPPARPAPAPTRAAAAASAARARPAQLLSPFTGEPVSRLEPVIAVKIDNIADARPQTGLQDADIVYVLPVEGGLSRFLAVFSSHLPPVIGPVRSAREDDLELIRQFGQPGFAYSGAAPHLLPFVERAPIVDLYAGLPSAAPAYYRYDGRVAPYNLYANSAALRAEAKGASDARDIGFRFGPVPAAAAGAAVGPAGYSAGYSSSSFTFRWSAGSGKWLVSMDGSPAMVASVGPATAESQLAAPTIVIQHTVIRTSRFLEYGKPPPYAQSVGSGTAVVLRGGKAYTVRWSRPSAAGGTTYTLPSGARMTFAPGQVWVMLVA